jgi:hypothetical protein
MCPSAQLEYLERIAQVEHIVRMQRDLNICNRQPEAANTYDLNMFIHGMRSDLALSLFIPSSSSTRIPHASHGVCYGLSNEGLYGFHSLELHYRNDV